MPQKKFIRTNARNYSKLGVRRKKKQKYRKGKGIDNKMRLNMKGHSRKVKAGFRTDKKTRGLVKELKPILVHNLEDLKKVGKTEIGILAKMGAKKRKELAQEAIRKDIKLSLDPRTILNKIEDKLKKSKEKQESRKGKRIEKDKKAKKEAEKKAKKEAKEEAKAAKGEETPEEKKEETKKTTDTSISDKKSSSEDEKTNEKSDKNKEIKETQDKPKQDNKKENQTNNYGRGK